MKRLKVALDLDGVLAGTPQIIDDEMHKRGYKFHNETYKTVIMGIEDCSEILQEVVDHIFYNRMYDILPCDEYMYNTIKEIDIISDISIITARRQEFNDVTRQWLDKYFPDTKMELIHLSSSEKPQFIKDNGFDAFVEDRLRTANQAARLGIKTYLINRRYNMNRRTDKGITRINNLSTFHSLLVSNPYERKEKLNKDFWGC